MRRAREVMHFNHAPNRFQLYVGYAFSSSLSDSVFVFQFPRNVTDCSPEFGTGKCIHNRIVDAVDHEKISQVKTHVINRVAIRFEQYTPV